ncbi:hypothetical protein [Acidisoma silvae]|uniref:Uncharacterized protein n=1 Tax=Acidisoma silvae TaxID=2802396 RepID=A0A963YX82_9PROT|nr:hypothetical protein [Acidisoma silvae]MCB8878514.1 hypothetical protein [Acidisoma silvae]
MRAYVVERQIRGNSTFGRPSASQERAALTAENSGNWLLGANAHVMQGFQLKQARKLAWLSRSERALFENSETLKSRETLWVHATKVAANNPLVWLPVPFGAKIDFEQNPSNWILIEIGEIKIRFKIKR